MTVTRKQVCEAMSKSMRDFGYPDVTDEMAGEILDAYNQGKRGQDLPHGVIGMFLESQISELAESGLDVAAI